MASDHLLIRIEHLTPTRLGLREQGLLLYSPSTVQTLKEELGHCHSVVPQQIQVYHNGELLSEKERVVDKRLYHVRLPSVSFGGESGFAVTGRTEKGLETIEKSVSFGEGVHLDGVVEVEVGPPIMNRVYIAFGWQGIVYLLDTAHAAILSPSPRLRLGYCIIYADWERLGTMVRAVPTVEPTMWLYDRLRRDYGVFATSSLFDVHTAPLAELHRYQSVVQAWVDRKTKSGEKDEEDDEGEEDEGEEYEGEEEGDEEEDFTDILDDLDSYITDAELWR